MDLAVVRRDQHHHAGRQGLEDGGDELVDEAQLGVVVQPEPEFVGHLVEAVVVGVDERLAAAWMRTWDAVVGSRQRSCRAVRSLVRRPRLTRAVLAVLASAPATSAMVAKMSETCTSSALSVPGDVTNAWRCGRKLGGALLSSSVSVWPSAMISGTRTPDS